MFDRLMLCLFAALLSGTLLREAPSLDFDAGIRTQARCAVGDCEGREASLRTLVSEVQSAVVTKSEWLNRLGMLTQRQRSAAVTLRMIDSSGARPHAATILASPPCVPLRI